MVRSQFVSMAPYQNPDDVHSAMVNILLYYLDSGEPYQAYTLIWEDMAHHEEFQTFTPMWYYGGLLARMCGRPGLALAAWHHMHENGVELNKVEPGLSQTLNLFTCLLISS